MLLAVQNQLCHCLKKSICIWLGSYLDWRLRTGLPLWRHMYLETHRSHWMSRKTTIQISNTIEKFKNTIFKWNSLGGVFGAMTEKKKKKNKDKCVNSVTHLQRKYVMCHLHNFVFIIVFAALTYWHFSVISYSQWNLLWTRWPLDFMEHCVITAVLSILDQITHALM